MKTFLSILQCIILFSLHVSLKVGDQLAKLVLDSILGASEMADVAKYRLAR